MKKVTFVTGVKNLKSYYMQITYTQLYRVVIGANKCNYSTDVYVGPVATVKQQRSEVEMTWTTTVK